MFPVAHLLTRAIQWRRQLPGNGLQHGAGLRENVVVPEANDAPSLLSQIRRALRISISSPVAYMCRWTIESAEKCPRIFGLTLRIFME
jgi:hypothetical protein